MSGVLTTLTGATAGIPGLSGAVSLVGRLVSGASWRGVPFYLVTGEDEAGNRPIKFMFPGQAKAKWQWLGAADGPMHVDGMLIGDDCVAQAAKMRAACQMGGSGKLRHPWFGQFDAVLTEPGHFAVSEAEFGIVRFSATFERYAATKPPGTDWFGRLQDSVTALMGEASDLLSSALDAISGPLSLYSFASGLLANAASVWDGLGVGAGGSGIAAAVAPAVADLLAAALPPDASFADAAAVLLLAPALALNEASQPPELSAIGAGPTAALSPPAIDPADAAAALLAASASLAQPGLPPYQAAIVLAAQMQCVGQAAAVGATIPFASIDDAVAWQRQIGTALAGLQAQAAQLATVMPLPAGAAWRATLAVRDAALADLSARALALPALQTITTDRVMDAWRIALQLYGDTPELMADAVVDLWSRNRAALPLGNPAVVPPGTYAVLAQ